MCVPQDISPFQVMCVPQDINRVPVMLAPRLDPNRSLLMSAIPRERGRSVAVPNLGALIDPAKLTNLKKAGMVGKGDISPDNSWGRARGVTGEEIPGW